jgi:ATP-binding cassette subfamily F protein uup
VYGYLEDFLFPAERARSPVKALSGGERNRLLLARLFTRPANVLILDEPTNDLDLETLEALEESLLEFTGALVLVTHDRFLFDRVSTGVLALDGRGGAERFADLAQWEAAHRPPSPAPRADTATATREPSARVVTGPKRLGYRERQEWESMEERILQAESALAECQAALTDPAVAADSAEVARRYAAAEAARHTVEALYARWAELDEKQR